MKISKRFGFTLISLFFLVLPGTSFADTASPAFLVGAPKNEAVFLQWIDFNTTTTDHLIEYKQTSGSNWTIFPHGESSTNGIVVTNLSNNTSYDFRVSSITPEGQSSPTMVTGITPSTSSVFTSNNQIIYTGQSLSVGLNSYPLLTTLQPYANKTLNASWSNLIPLVEPNVGGMGGETMSSGMANMITNLSGALNYSSIVTLSGLSSASYTDIQQGTPSYENGIASIDGAKFLSLLNNKTLIVPAVAVTHGESDDYEFTPAATYEQYLIEWQHDYETDIQSKTGQSEPVRMFLDQVSSWTKLGFEEPRAAIAQYEASKNNNEKIILVTPKYMLDYSDGLHLTGPSSRRLGEYYGKVYKKVVLDGEEWKPLMPEEVTISGNIISARFHVPVPPLAFDTEAVLLKDNYGFEYSDSTNSATITSVEIVSSDTVEITLNTTPTGANPRLRYAYTGTINAWAGRFAEGSARGNLRDSDTTPALYQDSNVPAFMGNYLRNWAVTFDEPVVVSQQDIADAPQLVTAVQGQSNGTAIVSFVAPTYTGTSAITHYIVTSTPGNITTTGTTSPITISGLSNNTTYTFRVVAVNTAGQSEDSTASNQVTIHWATLPVAPGAIGHADVVTTIKPRKPLKQESKTPIISQVLTDGSNSKLSATVFQAFEIKQEEITKSEVIEKIPTPETRQESKPLEAKEESSLKQETTKEVTQ